MPRRVVLSSDWDDEDDSDFRFNPDDEPTSRPLTDFEISNRDRSQSISNYNRSIQPNTTLSVSPVDDKFMDSFDTTIHNNPLTQPTTLYRGNYVPPSHPNYQMYQNLKPGDSFSRPGFTSTSANPESAHSFTGASGGIIPIPGAIPSRGHILRVNAPAGFPAYQMQYSGDNEDLEDEQEYTLPRNTTFHVTGHSLTPEGVHMWDVTPQAPERPDFSGKEYS